MKKKLEQTELASRLKFVWNEFVDFCSTSPEDLDAIRNRLDEWLDELHSEDFFGTEGQCDPRGDARNIDRKPKI